MTEIIFPDFLPVAIWRKVVQNNEIIDEINFTIITDDNWIPRILSSTGFFESGNQVKKNRKDLWRNSVHNESFKLGGWCRVNILHKDNVYNELLCNLHES